MEIQTWLIYLIAATGLAITPGPNSLLALTNGAIYGARKTLFTIFGGSLGFTAVIAMSMFGIGALLASSVELLQVLKWLGGAYLVFLGVQVWRSPAIGTQAPAKRGSGSGASLFQQGAFSAVANPKGVLFFVAFLPQFIDPRGNLVVQFLIMAATFVVIEIVLEWLLASGASKIQPWLKRAGRKFNRFTGGMFIAIGVALPLRG